MEKISCHTETIDAAWSAVKDFIPNSLCSKSKDLLLCVKCWQWICSGDMWICIPISSKKQFQRWSACSEKKERTNMSTCSNEMNPKPTWNRNFAKFSRENLAQFGLQKCLLRYGENALKKNVVFTSTVPGGPPGCILYLHIYIYICIYIILYNFHYHYHQFIIIITVFISWLIIVIYCIIWYSIIRNYKSWGKWWPWNWW